MGPQFANLNFHEPLILSLKFIGGMGGGTALVKEDLEQGSRNCLQISEGKSHGRGMGNLFCLATNKQQIATNKTRSGSYKREGVLLSVKEELLTTGETSKDRMSCQGQWFLCPEQGGNFPMSYIRLLCIGKGVSLSYSQALFQFSSPWIKK